MSFLPFYFIVSDNLFLILAFRKIVLTQLGELTAVVAQLQELTKAAINQPKISRTNALPLQLPLDEQSDFLELEHWLNCDVSNRLTMVIAYTSVDC